jgi:hypothetical protein
MPEDYEDGDLENNEEFCYYLWQLEQNMPLEECSITDDQCETEQF